LIVGSTKYHHGKSLLHKVVRGAGVPLKAYVRKRSNFFTHYLVGSHNMHSNMKHVPDSFRLLDNNSRINGIASRAQPIQKRGERTLGTMEGLCKEEGHLLHTPLVR